VRLRQGDINKDIDALLVGIRSVKDRVGENCTWTIADVLLSVIQGTSLFLIDGNDVSVSYVKEINSGKDKQLWVWVFYADSGDAFNKYLDDFKCVANNLGCKSIGLSTSRRGYEKYKDIFEYVISEYRINLDENN